ncbi:SOS response-associated peptidase [Paenibacillus sp. FSL L8-0463]|uniref:SOS response-associated peptidase n=1 Tax=Paenibacillus sp. FSL L8-0463 TaxID=2954687 RepID=UPI00311A43CE
MSHEIFGISSNEKKPIINARSETVSEYAMFRTSFLRRRIIIVADGFYEWMNTDTGKQPMRIVLKTRGIFSMAGIYESWNTPEGKKSSCAILTTEPNRIVAPIHNRMPVILHEDDEAAWLDRSNQDDELLRSFLKPYRADLMESYPVSKLVGDIKYNSELLLKKVSLEPRLF